MGAPKNNTNRKGKLNDNYQLSVPRLKCGTCAAKEFCPIAGSDSSVCGFLRRLRTQRNQLGTLDGIRKMRTQLIMDNLTQLNIMSMSQESKGVSNKEMITFRKVVAEQLAQLEKDTFDQEMKTKAAGNGEDYLQSLVKELAGAPKPALKEPAIDVPFSVQALPERVENETG